VEQRPKGFSRVAEFQNSDGNSALHRRFGALHARILLYLGIELTELEEQLLELDKTDNEKPDTRWRTAHSIHHDDGKGNELRKDLVEKIKKKLEEYGMSSGILLFALELTFDR
jgi:hypothetical protein